MSKFHLKLLKITEVFSDISITLGSPQTWQFLYNKIPRINFYTKLLILLRFFRITINVDCPHTDLQMLIIAEKILRLPDSINGCIVEAGAYKGGSTAKLSIIAKLTGRKLYTFDSFKGMPANNEIHSFTSNDNLAVFKKGSYYGSLKEVKSNIKLYGEIENCVFIKGLFDKTMPKFKEKIAVLFMDVDLVSSTKTVLTNLYPKISKKGLCYSHDGHLTFIIEIFKNTSFWRNDVGCKKPRISGLGKQKLIFFYKN